MPTSCPRWTASWPSSRSTTPARSSARGVRPTGSSWVLCEGGPTLLGHFLARGLLQELFLTFSPVIAGRSEGSSRPSFVAGMEFMHTELVPAALLSARRSGSHLFLRYGLEVR